MIDCSKNLSLIDLPVGKTGIVVKLLSDGKTKRRFLDLGLTPNTPVKKERLSPSGNPMAFIIRNTVIALRKEEAAKVLVNIIDWR